MNVETAARLNCTFLELGDILIARMPDPLGRACIFPGDPKASVTVVDVAVLRLGSCDFVAAYVVQAINSPQFARNVELKAAGTTRSRISRANLSLLSFPLPPLAEQHRIVAKVDELMALCDQLEAARAGREAMRDRLAATSLARLNAPDPDPAAFANHARFVLDNLAALATRPKQVAQLRQTILNLAVRGRLVPHDTGDEPADKLLDYLAQCLRLAQGNGDRSRRELEGVSAFFEDGTFPASWAVTQFEKVHSVASGIAKGKSYAGHKTRSFPYLRVANVQRGHLDLSVVKQLDIRVEELDRYRLRKGDVLMTEGGDWDKLGRAAIWNDEVPDCIHQNHIFRIRSADQERLLPQWTMLFANSRLGRSYFENASKQTTNLASINMT